MSCEIFNLRATRKTAVCWCFRMDSVYPEPLSRLYRRTVRKKVHKNNSARYRTQPITFSEIQVGLNFEWCLQIMFFFRQEVDEENVDDGERSAASMSKSEMDLKAKFEEFKRKRDKDFRDSKLGPFTGMVSIFWFFNNPFP